MKIEFIGPEKLAKDGGVDYPTLVNGHAFISHFSYEALEDVDPGALMGDPLEHFARHKLKLLSIAEQKILSGHAHASQIQIFSNDLITD